MASINENECEAAWLNPFFGGSGGFDSGDGAYSESNDGMTA